MFRRFFRTDLMAGATISQPTTRPDVPTFTLVVLALTLAGFAVTSFLGVNPAWAALAGVLMLGSRALGQRRTTVRELATATSPLFCLFVLALSIVVKAVVDNGLDDAARHLIPAGTSLTSLLAIAALAALLANLINNLPAILALLPLVAVGGSGPVLAALIGVNLGPNLTYVGSLATLLWRRILREHRHDPELADFTRLGLITVPATVVAATMAVWVMLHAIGG